MMSILNRFLLVNYTSIKPEGKKELKQKWVWVDWKKERKKTNNQKNDLRKHKTA